MQYKSFSDAELAQFKKLQRQCFATLVAVGKTLKAGMTEREVAYALRQSFREQGVRSYFHVPVALFGDRTAYPGDFGQFEALATDRVLEPGMAVILDAAPIYKGYLVDTSMPFAFGDNSLMDDLTRKLEPFRSYILEQVRAEVSFRDIERSVDSMIRDLGAENCHRKHIGLVMGHRVMKISWRPWNHLEYKLMAVPQISWFFWKSFLAQKGWQNDSPNWNHTRTSDHPPSEGLWAVEPHFAIDGVGTKFEEIMVITDSDAYWLDDDLPHNQVWAGAKSTLEFT